MRKLVVGMDGNDVLCGKSVYICIPGKEAKEVTKITPFWHSGEALDQILLLMCLI